MIKQHFVYFRLQLKRIFRLIPRLMAGAIVLTVLVGAIAFCGTKLLYSERSAREITVALIVEDDSKLMDFGMTYLESSESVNSFCRLVRVSKEESKHMFENGEISASIYFPEHFARDIVDGTNTPAVITFARETGIEQLLFDELTAAASRILVYAQSGIYTLSDLYDSYQFEKSRGKNFDYLNSNTLQTALVRGELFRREQISATGELSVKEYYMVSAVVLLLLLTAMSVGAFALPEKGSLASCLSLQGLSGGLRVFYRQAALAVFYVVVLLTAALAGWWLGVFSRQDFILIPVLAVFLSCRVLFYYTLTGSEMTGVLLLFVLTLSDVCLSGCLLPVSFLPQAMRTIGRYLPAYHMHKLLGTVFVEGSLFESVWLLVYSFCFLCFGMILQRRHTR